MSFEGKGVLVTGGSRGIGRATAKAFREAGARVAVGDTLGEVGNTGNAATTPPHLHFGIYGRGGAVDPEPYVVGRRPATRTARPLDLGAEPGELRTRR